MIVVPHEVLSSFASRAFEVSCSFQDSLRRVCVPEMTWQDVVVWMVEIHV